ncbi:MAG TPA: sulfite exporter TauE/SafE family protein [Clostridiales bacterium]|nr:sulfite exporter TauE/SafE family protein [Clostridiales bacterium]
MFRKRMLIIFILGLTAGFNNGLFGSGGGTILVPGIFFLLGVSQHKAHATTVSIILPLTLITTWIYMKYKIILWDIAIKIMIGSIIGGYIGAKLLPLLPERVLRNFFAILILIAAIRMVFQ